MQNLARVSAGRTCADELYVATASRLGDSLSRQAGGIGGRGPGETKIETDRRRINDKMAKLRTEIKR